MSESQPSPPRTSVCIGQVVHYVSDGRCLAGIVIGFVDGPNEVALYVLDPELGPFYAYPAFSLDRADDTWHWMGVGEGAPYPWKELEL